MVDSPLDDLRNAPRDGVMSRVVEEASLHEDYALPCFVEFGPLDGQDSLAVGVAKAAVLLEETQ